VPQLGNASTAYGGFSTAIENYCVQVKIRHGRRIKGYSVALDPANKEKLRHYLTQIKITVDRLEVNYPKKEALYRCISALENEIDRDRTKWEAYGALAIEIANTGGRVARELKPAWSLIGTIGKLLGIAKESETGAPPLTLAAPQRRLPAPEATNRPEDTEAE
jgi:hypothetical protein